MVLTSSKNWLPVLLWFAKWITLLMGVAMFIAIWCFRSYLSCCYSCGYCGFFYAVYFYCIVHVLIYVGLWRYNINLEDISSNEIRYIHIIFQNWFFSLFFWLLKLHAQISEELTWVLFIWIYFVGFVYVIDLFCGLIVVLT